jgi:hypothetical protein
MPIYRNKYRGVQLSEALAQSAAIAPITYAMLSAFEVRHPSQPVIRFVNNPEPIWATLEATAAVDANALVKFVACSVQRTRPEESADAGTPEISITISNVSGVVTSALNASRGSLIPWMITERLYASNDLTGPAILPPITMEISKVQVYGSYITLTASYRDPTNIAIPKLTFKLAEYPGIYAI